ncbi:MerR family transcriptional regulator [Latilactobacillus curvatus]|uniref:MerR family transcriptional regulator n=1 Tax=Latilactobacillus curvatus TaxID=28038 RepID=UPI000FEC9E38|nr:MerR family transcriptional regulator [Latilactobacillus curvatus]QAR34850.1 MerR family transcriptional regulator [Latilactobacillus curvatus]
MLKISEFAKLAKTTRRTLLFYDEKGLFSPTKTTENGYRFYEPDQLYQFELISGLRQLGMSLDDIQAILAADGAPLAEYIGHYQQKIAVFLNNHSKSIETRLS